MSGEGEKGGQMVAAARSCLHTPFHHQGRSPHAGLDCIGLVIVALREIEIPVRDCFDYAPRPAAGMLEAALSAHGAVRLGPDVVRRAGDVLLFRFDHQPQHVALATGAQGMIHSYAPARRVVETDLGAFWLRRLVAVYRFAWLERSL